MLFNSFDFLIFFPTVVAVYFLLPQPFRWAWLLAASCYFYMVFIPVYILILFVTIVIDYFAGMWIEDSKGKRRKVFLVISIISTCLVLFIFKYFNFFNANMTELAKFLHWNYPISYLSIILPLGLSFHTFQSLSYVIEVYRGHQKAERHFGIYSLYVMFFPQLVAGPIERPQNLLHQFYEKHKFNPEMVSSGLKLMMWGFFKKLVVADRVAIYVNAVYNNVDQHSGVTLWVATFFFAVQIYCDFSGYSDIAIGAARVMGFRLMQNFRTPYFAQSIREFWTRWHISLSTWFRDYVYVPLGGSRVSRPKWYRNLMIVFVISGVWHGANWTFLVWGALHGFYLIFSLMTAEFREKITENIFRGAFLQKCHSAIKIGITFFLVCIAWVFFRANSLTEAGLILQKMFFAQGPLYTGSSANLLYAVLAVFLLLLIEVKNEIGFNVSLWTHPNMWVRQFGYVSVIILILLLGVFGGGQFIYFQF